MGMGEILSLACALSWAIGVVVMKHCGRSYPPLSINIFRNFFSFIMLLPLILIFEWNEIFSYTRENLLIIAISGLIGITLADTLFLYALKNIGASLMAVVECIYSPFVVLLSYLFLDEHLNLWQTIGFGLVLSAILIITVKPKTKPTGDKVLQGIGVGLFATLIMSGALVMIKPILNQTPLLTTIGFRFLVANLGLMIVVGLQKKPAQVLRPLWGMQNFKDLLPSAFFGCYLSMILWIAGVKYTTASVAAILNQTSTVFIIVLAVIFLKEKITLKLVASSILATAGVLLTTLLK